MFKARESKPCTYCNVVIEKGCNTGWTWDRTNSGFIHLACMTARRTGKSGSIPTMAVSIAVPTLSNGNGNGHDDKAGALMKALQAMLVSPQINESEIRRIVADEVLKVAVNRSIEIKLEAMPSIRLEMAHKDLPMLLRLASTRNASGHRLNVYMHGPAGSGKSSAAFQVSTVLKLGRGFGYISLNPQTPESRLIGYMHAGGEYVASEFFKCYTEGGIFCLDEIDNASASLATTLNSLLENGHGAFPHGIYPRHPDFVCICTANTIGLGGDIQYPERRALDGAFRERFVFLEWAYDTALTKAIVTAIIGDYAGEFIAWVDSEAQGLQARYPTLIVSPRAYIQGATLSAIGWSRDQIRNSVIARGLK